MSPSLRELSDSRVDGEEESKIGGVVGDVRMVESSPVPPPPPDIHIIILTVTTSVQDTTTLRVDKNGLLLCE